MDEKKLIDSSKFIDLRTCQRSLDFVIRNYPGEKINISFFGGEPLLAWSLIVRWLEWDPRHHYPNIDFSHSITTNGSLLDVNKINFLVEKDVELHISLDDLNPRKYIFETIQKITSIENYQQKSFLSVRVAINNPHTDLIAFYQKLKKLDVKRIHVMPVTARNYEYESFIEKYDLLFAECVKEIYKERIVRNAQIKWILTLLYNNEIKKQFCALGEKYLAVNTDGTIYPCTGFLDILSFEQGNIFTSSDEQILDNLHKFANNAKFYNKTDCLSCWMKNICAGNCTHFAFLLTGDCRKIVHKECKWIKFLGEKTIELYNNLITRDEYLLHVLVNGPPKWDIKLKVAQDAYLGNSYVYKSNIEEHQFFELDKIQREMFIHFNGDNTLMHIFKKIKEKFPNQGINERDFITCINEYIEQNVLVQQEQTK